MLMIRTFSALALLVIASAPVTAQDTPTPPGAALRIFLDCQSCDFDYTRQATRWAEFVRDRTVADVHVLVTQIGTGAGGDEYTIELVGLGRFAPRADTLRFISQPTATDDEERQGLTRTLHLGLAPFAARTPAAALLALTYGAREDDDDERSPVGSDPWRAWVFEIGVEGSIEREQRQRDSEISGSLEASRVTAIWKSGLEVNADRSDSRFELEDRTVTTTRESYNAGGVVIRSLGGHWGAGAEASISSSTFENTRRAVRAAPAIEYSVWPYTEATRRQLTLQYSVGVSSYSYREATIFDKLKETRPTQTLVVSYDVQQRWGSADASFEYANYVDDRKQYRLEFDGELSIRLTRGLELELGANVSQIRDQLSIAKRDATDEEILLELRDLRTDYRFDARVGLSFTFGSIFNSVVNPRFGSGPGSILR
jgi:hypothetical protein